MVMIGDNVRVVELRNHLHLVNDGSLAGGVLTVQLFDGNEAMGNILAGEKHRAEGAFPQLPLEPINVVESLGHGCADRLRNGFHPIHSFHRAAPFTSLISFGVMASPAIVWPIV